MSSNSPLKPIENELPTRNIGQSQVDVSVIGMGTAPLGGLFQASSDDAALQSIKAAIDGGITHFDTAPSYGMGLAETRLGKAIKTLSNDSSNEYGYASPVLSTKVGRVLVKGQQQDDHTWAEKHGTSAEFDFSYDGIIQSVEDSLSRSGLSRFDILFVHDPDRFAQDAKHLSDVLVEAYAAVDKLKQKGATSAIGIGVNAAEPCQIALDIGNWDCFMLAGCYSVLSQEDNGLLKTCLESSVSVIAAAPFLSGVLAGGDHWRYGPIPDGIKNQVLQLRALCARHAVPIEAAALQFPLFHPAICNVVTGMRSAEEVKQNLAHLDTNIPESFWDDLIANEFIAKAHAVYITEAFC